MPKLSQRFPAVLDCSLLGLLLTIVVTVTYEAPAFRALQRFHGNER